MPLSLLLVDDSPFGRKMVKKCLPPGDYRIREASDGRECLDLYRQEAADLVFLDLTMPEMDGFETLARLKEIDPDCRVIVVSADIQPAAREEVMKLGALDFIKKPPSSETIKEAVARVQS
ncbi:MAG: response regulator [Deltaproteobacteria bacterium]|nr:response regulator [Deltaproteobacteria bacterium]